MARQHLISSLVYILRGCDLVTEQSSLSAKNGQIAAALEYIDSCFSSDVGISELCKIANMGRSNFERLFGKYVGRHARRIYQATAHRPRDSAAAHYRQNCPRHRARVGLSQHRELQQTIQGCNRSYSRKLSKQAVNEVFTLSMNTSFLYSFYIFIWLHNLDMA